jgi:hypothetical protein
MVGESSEIEAWRRGRVPPGLANRVWGRVGLRLNAFPASAGLGWFGQGLNLVRQVDGTGA